MGIEDHLPEGFEVPLESSEHPSFWNHFWRHSVSPWDLGGPHPELLRRMVELGGKGRAYVPGCGRGHDALCLAKHGWDVTAVDLAEELVPHRLPELTASGSRFLVRDAFCLAEGEVYDLWWDHTFFCAIPPNLRQKWGASVLAALPEGGTVGALIFPFGKELADGGPPFGISVGDMLAVLGEKAHLRCDEPVRAPGRQGSERFALIDIDPAQ